MRDSEREPFYDDIAHVIQNTVRIKCKAHGIRTRDGISFGHIITVHDHCASDKIRLYTHIIVPNVQIVDSCCSSFCD